MDMRTFFLLFGSLFLMTSLEAQSYRISTARNVSRTTQVSVNHQAVISLAAADLILPDQTLLYQNPHTGTRFLRVSVQNTGNRSAAASQLKITYSWRFDYEAFSQQTLVRHHHIPALSVGQSTQLWIQIPDDKIRSNPGFGSSYVRLRMEADASGIILEQNEKNNHLHKSLPILQ